MTNESETVVIDTPHPGWKYYPDLGVHKLTLGSIDLVAWVILSLAFEMEVYTFMVQSEYYSTKPCNTIIEAKLAAEAKARELLQEGLEGLSPKVELPPMVKLNKKEYPPNSIAKPEKSVGDDPTFITLINNALYAHGGCADFDVSITTDQADNALVYYIDNREKAFEELADVLKYIVRGTSPWIWCEDTKSFVCFYCGGKLHYTNCIFVKAEKALDKLNG